ncbi:MAG: hypothetical protein E7552_00080 [Ruminococcaceae bacterium]|nr:hypothetical protein [Oscillospiraceae bacterium]
MKTWLRENLLRPPVREDALAEAMQEVCGQLQSVDSRFAEETDEDLLDACMYERLALQARYRYLTRLVRRRVQSV